jgi:hypothetical protein
VALSHKTHAFNLVDVWLQVAGCIANAGQYITDLLKCTMAHLHAGFLLACEASRSHKAIPHKASVLIMQGS